MRVLIAVSAFSEESSADPIALVTSFPWPAETTFTALTAAAPVHPPVAGLMDGAVDVPEVQRDIDAASAKAANAAARRLKEHGLNCLSVSREGDPEAVILDYAKSWNAELIVVGSSDRSAFERFLVGSVSQGVIKHAPCSVLLVKAVHSTADARTREESTHPEPAPV